jgi:CBS domain containing-hemolysin-like protein
VAETREEITDEEIRAIVRGSSTLGEEDRQIVEDVFDAGARSLREVMVPRTEVDFLAGTPQPSSRPRCAQCRALPLSGDR